MKRALLACLVAFSLAPAPVEAGDGHGTLGWGRLFTNDALGDGRDRWRTGAYAVSWVRGLDWPGSRPETPFSIMEYRLRADILAPANLATPAPGDRPYAGVLTLSAHTHWAWRDAELSFGAGLAVTGPMTGLGELQRLVHELLGMTPPTGALNGQIGNAVRPQVSLEAGKRVPLSRNAVFRPFVAAEVGGERLVRAGGEVLVGDIWNGALLLRDDATGQLYTGIRSERRGFGFVLGGDIAYVASSDWLPANRGYVLTDLRTRARAGIRWQGEKSSAFYGLTYLGPEFRAQGSGQFLGSVSIDIKF